MSLLFNQISLNEELLPNYALTHTHTYIYICICSPTPVGLSSLANEVIALPLAYMQGSSYELSSPAAGFLVAEG